MNDAPGANGNTAPGAAEQPAAPAPAKTVEVIPDDNAAITQLTVLLPTETVKAMQEIAQSRNIPVTQVIRQALENERFFQKETDNGTRILLDTPGMQLRKVTLK